MAEIWCISSEACRCFHVMLAPAFKLQLTAFIVCVCMCEGARWQGSWVASAVRKGGTACSDRLVDSQQYTTLDCGAVIDLLLFKRAGLLCD